MSLRTQLTIQYAALAGVILLVFSLVIFGLVNVVLVDQLDQAINQTAEQIITQARVNAFGDLEMVELPSLEVTSNVFVQVWTPNNELQTSSPNINRLGKPLDPIGLRTNTPIFRDNPVNTTTLRVLSVPLVVEGRKIAVLQAGINRGLVDATLKTLVYLLGVAVLLFMSISALAAWLSTGQALAPLERVTDTALSISRADDLSRRIPNPNKSQNEIGILIETFNQTLNRLEHLFTSQKRFMADVSHELRTPLTVIKGNAGLLRKMKKPDEEALMSIEEEVDRLTRMVGDLLLLAQAESGKLPLDLKTVELDGVITDVYNQVKVLSGGKVDISISEIEPVQVLADKDRMKQVFLNLLANAVKYTPPGGKVFIALKRVENRVQAIIRDTGPGIPSQDLPYIFERFYRADKSRTRSTDGSSFGLGLSIAYWIVKNHGGVIDVASSEGAGTTFSVWLPVV